MSDTGYAMELTESWYFTFGVDHPQYSMYYVVIKGSWNEARGEMIKRYGSRWSFQYDSPEAAGVERYGLKELTADNV